MDGGTMIDANSGEESDQRSRRAIMSDDQLDVEAYAAQHSGRTKIMRLLFIASKSKNPAVQLDTLRMAYNEIKKGEKTQLFREFAQKISRRWSPNYEMDLSWCEGVDWKAEQKKERLEISVAF